MARNRKRRRGAGRYVVEQILSGVVVKSNSWGTTQRQAILSARVWAERLPAGQPNGALYQGFNIVRVVDQKTGFVVAAYRRSQHLDGTTYARLLP